MTGHICPGLSADDGRVVVREVLPRQRHVEGRREEVEVHVGHRARRREADQRVALARLERDHHHGVLSLLEGLLQLVAVGLHARAPRAARRP